MMDTGYIADEDIGSTSTRMIESELRSDEEGGGAAQKVNESKPTVRRKPRFLNNAFASHRFDRDILDLTSCRNQYFLPHARVWFFIRDSGGQQRTVKELKNGKQQELKSLLCGIEPLDGAYCGVTWRFVIELPESYPFRPPIIRSLVPIYHPNIDPNSGVVSLPLLGEDWSPVLTLRIVVLGLVLLFVEPNLKTAVNFNSAYLLQNDMNSYLSHVSNCKMMAMKDPEDRNLMKLINSKRCSVELSNSIHDHDDDCDKSSSNSETHVSDANEITNRLDHFSLSQQPQKRRKVT